MGQELIREMRDEQDLLQELVGTRLKLTARRKLRGKEEELCNDQ